MKSLAHRTLLDCCPTSMWRVIQQFCRLKVYVLVRTRNHLILEKLKFDAAAAILQSIELRGYRQVLNILKSVYACGGVATEEEIGSG